MTHDTQTWCMHSMWTYIALIHFVVCVPTGLQGLTANLVSTSQHTAQVLAWLRCKVQQSLAAFEEASPGSIAGLDDQGRIAYVLGFVSEYLAPKWQAQLAQHYGQAPTGEAQHFQVTICEWRIKSTSTAMRGHATTAKLSLHCAQQTLQGDTCHNGVLEAETVHDSHLIEHQLHLSYVVVQSMRRGCW